MQLKYVLISNNPVDFVPAFDELSSTVQDFIQNIRDIDLFKTRYVDDWKIIFGNPDDPENKRKISEFNEFFTWSESDPGHNSMLKKFLCYGLKNNIDLLIQRLFFNQDSQYFFSGPEGSDRIGIKACLATKDPKIISKIKNLLKNYIINQTDYFRELAIDQILQTNDIETIIFINTITINQSGALMWYLTYNPKTPNITRETKAKRISDLTPRLKKYQSESSLLESKHHNSLLKIDLTQDDIPNSPSSNSNSFQFVVPANPSSNSKRKHPPQNQKSNPQKARYKSNDYSGVELQSDTITSPSKKPSQKTNSNLNRSEQGSTQVSYPDILLKLNHLSKESSPISQSKFVPYSTPPKAIPDTSMPTLSNPTANPFYMAQQLQRPANNLDVSSRNPFLIFSSSESQKNTMPTSSFSITHRERTNPAELDNDALLGLTALSNNGVNL